MAASTTTEVKWYGQKVSVVFKTATAQSIKRLAFLCEAAVKERITANGQINTGFMRNSVYTVTSDGKTGGAESTTLADKTGKSVERISVSPPELTGEHVAIVGVGANYAVYQELANSFMRVSFDQIVGKSATIIAEEFAKVMND